MKSHGRALAAFGLIVLSAPGLAWSPKVHERQTRLALALIPRGMASFLSQHHQALFMAERQVSAARAPTPEDVEGQFAKVLAISENGRPASEIVQELGRLAFMVQLLTDPSAASGPTTVRWVFSGFADGHFDNLVAAREPIVAATGDINPRQAIQSWSSLKYERFRSLSSHINPHTGEKIGTWDILSVPFALMQLGFSAGINATANIWIYAWRAAGSLWVIQG